MPSTSSTVVFRHKQNGRAQAPPNLGVQESKEDLVPSQGKAPASPISEPRQNRLDS
ncbi:hypothetical protein EMIT0P201_70336 [Pseudomonas chlororaphis]